MILTVDIGNTNIDFGVFDNDKLTLTFSLAADKSLTADQYVMAISDMLKFYGVQKSDIEHSAISSVVPPLTDVLKDALKNLTVKRIVNVCTGTKTGLFIKTENPSRLGSDFVCAAVGALKISEAPCVVFDLGTAITVTAIDSSKALVGTAILPGLTSSVRALWQNTAQLPMISLEHTASPLGKNTQDAMRAGALYGTAAAIDGLFEQYRSVLGEDTKLILTGGDAHLITEYCRSPFTFERHVTLYGLNKICRKNI